MGVKKYSWLFLAILVACNPVTVLPTHTSTSIPIPEIAPTFVLPSEIPDRFELHQPQSSDLLKIIDSVLLIEENLAYNDDVTTAILEREPSSLQRLIGEDFERYYLNGFPNADVLVISKELPWEMKSFGDLNSFSTILRIALLQYINNHQDVLNNDKPFQLPNVNIRTFSMDLDGDGNLEWLIGAEYEKYSLQNWLLFNKQADGFYHFLPSFGYDLAGIQDYTSDIEVHDLTGDKNPEIIKIQHFYLAGNIHGEIEVYTWREDRLSLLESIPLPSSPPIYGESSSYTIHDFNGDGLAEIRVDSPQFRRFGCEWTKSSIYYLDGRSPEVEVTGEEIPHTDDCLIARALENENIDEQIQLYREALRKFDPKVSPMDKLAWIRLQLSMAYTANGDDVRAKSQLDDLINMQSEGKFLKFIKDKHEETSSPSPLVLCDALYSSIASQDIPESIGSEIDIDLTHGAYPIDFAPIANLICPFPDVLSARLGKLKIPISMSPVDGLIANGYTFTWTQSLNWDNDPVQEWLGVLRFDQPILAFIDGDENWDVKTIEIYSSGLSKVESAVYTPAGGTEPKILVLFSGKGKYCDSPSTVKWLLEINPETVKYENLYLCDTTTYSFANENDIQLALQEFSKPHYYEEFKAPDWYYLPDTQENEYERRTILNLVNEIESSVLSQTDAEKVNSEISTLISSLPTDDSAAQILLNRLYYLQGLNYELGGQSTLAVETYLSLIRRFPDSIWSKLARLRISQP